MFGRNYQQYRHEVFRAVNPQMVLKKGADIHERAHVVNRLFRHRR